MSVKTVTVDGVGTVHLFKKRGIKSLRLSITRKGEVRVSLPFWTTYGAATSFAVANIDWITAHQTKVPTILAGSRIGRRHRLIYQTTNSLTVKTRLDSPDIIIKVPSGLNTDNTEVRAAVTKACIRALKAEANSDLPGKLKLLADTHGFSYASVSIKRLTGRWGSCDSKQNITLNCYLQQLPPDLVNYVLLHELVHTKIMAHGKVFWDELRKYDPQLTLHRAQIKQHQPILKSGSINLE